MASFVVTPGLFPVGTTVSARLRTNWPPSERDAPTGTPGSATTSGDIDAAGELTLTGLTDDTRYILHGTIGADEKYVQIQTPPAAAEGGGGGGGAVTVADGDDEAIGATTSSESASGNGTVVGILKRLRTLLGGGLPTDLSGSGNLKVAVEEGGVAAGASTEAKQDTLIGHVDGLEAQIGEVQATPTANTVLSRLKAIDDTLVSGGGSATESTLQDILAKILVAPANAAKQDTIIGHVDGIEALLTADAITAAVRDRIGEVQASPTANTLLARLKTIEGYSDGIETALALLATAAQVGEVQATPTANTVLSRLKAINDTLVAGGGDATEATLAAIETLLSGTLTTVVGGSVDVDPVALKPQTDGGLHIVQDIDLDETETAIKATPGQLYGWYIYNDGAAEVYVKLYNATTANVTVGTTTPVMTLGVPAGGGTNVHFGPGLEFLTAITAAATTVATVADATAPVANQVVANFFYL